MSQKQSKHIITFDIFSLEKDKYFSRSAKGEVFLGVKERKPPKDKYKLLHVRNVIILSKSLTFNEM